MQEETNSERFAVVHLEASGATARAKIIELVAYIVEEVADEVHITDTFSVLLNPGTKLKPELLAQLDISAEELDQASTFADVAEDLSLFLHNIIFVSADEKLHLKLLTSEFKKAGIDFKTDELSLSQLAAEKIQDQQLKDFDQLVNYFELNLDDQTSTSARATLTVEVLQNLKFDIKTKSDYELSYTELHGSHPGLDLSSLTKLSNQTGLLQLYNDGKPIYVEKFNSLKNEVPKYLLKFKEMYDQEIDTIQMAHFHDPLIALRKKEERIRRLKPVLNYSERRDAWGVFHSENPFTLKSMPLLKGKGTLIHYAPKQENTERWIDIQMLEGQQDEYTYVDMEDPALMSRLKKEREKQVRAKIKPFLEYPHDDFVVMGPGRDDDELSCHFFIKRKLYGHAFLSGQQVYGLDKCPNSVRPIKENDFLKYLILKELQSWSSNPSINHSIKVLRPAPKETKGNSNANKNNKSRPNKKKKSRSNNRNKRSQP